MSIKNITYVVLCGRGLQRNECPIIAQGGCCVECNAARYMPRHKEQNTSDYKGSEENNNTEDV